MLLGTAVVALAACGAGEPSGQAPTEPGAESAPGDSLVLLVEGGGHAALPPIADAFEEETGTRITFVELPYENMYDRINTELTSGQLSFDIAAIGGELLPAFANGMEPMGELFTEEVRADLFPALVSEAEPYGELVAMPIWTNAELLLYRTDLFEDPVQQEAFEDAYGYELAPPTTWQEYQDAAVFFTQDTDGDGSIDLYGADVKGAEDAEWLATVLQAGASSPVVTPDGEVIIDDAAHLAALDYYAGLNAEHQVSPPGAAQIDWAAAQNLFNQGQTAMTKFWAHAYTQVPEDSPAYGNVGVVPMPAGAAGTAAIPGAYYLTVPKQTVKKDIAMQFVSFAYEHNDLILDTSMGLAARKSALESKAGVAGFEALAPLVETLDAAATQPRPALPEWRQIVESVIVPMLQKAVVDDSNNQQLLDDAKVQIERILER